MYIKMKLHFIINEIIFYLLLTGHINSSKLLDNLVLDQFNYLIKNTGNPVNENQDVVIFTYCIPEFSKIRLRFTRTYLIQNIVFQCSKI